ncbi:glucose-1-phosphate cytidylyltransferase [Patescibacteria group bacterium]|nr:glucose-1-phosphate cytidylyltransferase [Patescibacteria group bacterium]MBU1953012.1 glucose-1-phosphate cytidylyltransferase [Patescibacteria group bacterium]
MKTIILCGGRGMRLQEETEFKPKPIIKIGSYPILLHIMNIYAHYGHKDFIVCLGYKGELIKDYFLTLSRYSDDFKFDMKTGKTTLLNKRHNHDHNITFVETGEDTMTTDRVLQALEHVEEDHFMVTYGDGVSTIDINRLVDFHMEQEKKFGTYATVSCVHPHSKYGVLTFNKDNLVTAFVEKKPILRDYINGGFQVYNKKAVSYFKKNEMIEDSLIRLTEDQKLSMYRHDGFWHCMDTMKDYLSLNKLWESGSPPWVVWEKGEGKEL